MKFVMLKRAKSVREVQLKAKESVVETQEGHCSARSTINGFKLALSRGEKHAHTLDIQLSSQESPNI
jgi:hypothetical protein